MNPDEKVLHEFVRRGQAADRAAAEAVYRSMRTPELEQLRAAFQLDRQANELRGDAAAIAFCDGRLAIIAEVLAAR